MKKLLLLSLFTIALNISSIQAENIVDAIKSEDNLSTLASLINKAGLADTLKNLPEVTILAPVNSAFDKIDPKTLASLTIPDIQNILKNHVIIGKALAQDVTKMSTVKPLGGKAIMITVRNGTVFFDETAKVTQADILTSNGVIHLIDTVILP